MSRALPLACGALALGALVLTACQSTQDKNAERLASLGPIKEEEGLEINQQSEDVEVLDTAMLTDENGTAVVVQLRNNSEQTLVDVPIAINVLDAKGKSVFKNNLPGVEPALVSMPVLGAGETAYWVHNQVFSEGEEVEVKVGRSTKTLPPDLPEITVEEPVLQEDPTSGIEADGILVNDSEEEIPEVLFYGVALDGDEIVAAGRGAVEEVKPGRRRHYDIYFIGDPREGELAVTHFINLDAE